MSQLKIKKVKKDNNEINPSYRNKFIIIDRNNKIIASFDTEQEAKDFVKNIKEY